MRCKQAHQGHQNINPDNKGASEIWMSLNTLNQIHKFNDEIPGTRYDNLLKYVTIQKWGIKKPQTRSHNPRVPKSILQKTEDYI